MSMSIICGSAMAFWHQHIGLFMTQRERWLAIREKTVMTGIRKLSFLKTMPVVIGWGMHKFHCYRWLIPIINPKHVGQLMPEVRSLELLIHNDRNRDGCYADRLFTLIDIGGIFLLRLYHAGSFQLRQYTIYKNVWLLLAVLFATKNRHLNDVASYAFYLVTTFVVCKQLCGICLQQSFPYSDSKQAFDLLPCEYSAGINLCTHNYIICGKFTKILGDNCDFIKKLHIIWNTCNWITSTNK